MFGFVPFLGISIATVAQVGNRLGNNDPLGAKKVVQAAMLIHPVLVTILGIGAFLPVSRHALVGFLARDGSEQLLEQLNWLVRWIILHLAADGVQTVLGGVLTGCGLQQLGLYTNVVVFGGVAIPMIVVFSKVLGLGLKGLFYGIFLAPVL